MRVKPFLVTKREQITVEIEITKTIDSLRKAVFSQLDESMANYYNIKLCTTTPVLTELTTNSKTIAQSQIKDNDKLVLTADYAFTFAPVRPHPRLNVTISGQSLTVTTLEAPKAADPKVPIALPAISEQPEIEKAKEEGKDEPKPEEKKE